LSGARVDFLSVTDIAPAARLGPLTAAPDYFWNLSIGSIAWRLTAHAVKSCRLARTARASLGTGHGATPRRLDLPLTASSRLWDSRGPWHAVVWERPHDALRTRTRNSMDYSRARAVRREWTLQVRNCRTQRLYALADHGATAQIGFLVTKVTHTWAALSPHPRHGC